MSENINLRKEEENLWYRKELLWVVLANVRLMNKHHTDMKTVVADQACYSVDWLKKKDLSRGSSIDKLRDSLIWFEIDSDSDSKQLDRRSRNDDLTSQWWSHTSMFNTFTWSSYSVSMLIIVLVISINHSLTFSMIQNFQNAKTDSDLIRLSAIISLMNKYLRVIFFSFIIFLIQCQRIFMCYIFLWYCGLMMRLIAFLLSA
jgi:hypothetical protein